MTDRFTDCVRAGIGSDELEGAVIAPIYLSTTYAHAGVGEPRRFDYSRTGNPTRHLLETTLARLEGGAAATVTASGMGAISTVLHTVLRAGDRLLIPHDCYGGSWQLFQALAAKGVYDLVVADLTGADAAQKVAEVRPKLLWLETPSNPLLRLIDIEALAAAGHEVDAVVAVDNTFATPLGQQPLALGADLCVHSSTKFINGHSDVVSGVVIARTPELGERLALWAKMLGVTGGAFDSYLVTRGLKTLRVRLAAHVANARAVADFLAAHPAVARVHYPGLADHPQAALVARQMSAPGAVLSFELADASAVAGFVARLRVFSLAVSLGGVESLICHPATSTHSAMSPDEQAAAGITAGLLRISVGIESVDDLLTDLGNALG